MLKTISSKIFIFSLLLSFFSCSSNENEANEDIEKPTISCPATINVNIDGAATEIMVIYTTPVGADNVSAETTQTAGLESGALFPLGTTTNTFVVKDPSGNTATCSFDVIVTQSTIPDGSAPTFTNENPAPSGKKWVKIENLSDEFDGSSIDTSKWHTKPVITESGWFWDGRPPGLFIEESISVEDGKLKIEANKLPNTLTQNNKSYDYTGGIVRSINQCKVGCYYETAMKANKTFMSSTFWMMTEENACPKRTELDVQECIGEITPGAPDWVVNGKWDEIFHSNAFHRTSCQNDTATRKQDQLGTPKNWSDFFIYGFWWKSETELWFYFNGELAYKITNPTTDFDIPMYYNLAVETYDWNPPHPDGNGMEGLSKDERSTQYEWIRTWKLEDL